MAATTDIIALLDQIIERYRPGGEFGKPEEALLKREKEKSLAETQQGMVTAGMAGTTAGVGAGRRWEEEVGMPARLKLEDIRTGRLTEAMGAKAGYMERAEARTAAEQEAARQRMFSEYQRRMVLEDEERRIEEAQGLRGSWQGLYGAGRIGAAGAAGTTAGAGAGGGTGATYGGMGGSYTGGGGAGDPFAGYQRPGVSPVSDLEKIGSSGYRAPGSTTEAISQTQLDPTQGMREAEPGAGPQPTTGYVSQIPEDILARQRRIAARYA